LKGLANNNGLYWALNNKLDLHNEEINIQLKGYHFSVIYKKDYFEKYRVLRDYDNAGIDNFDYEMKIIEISPTIEMPHSIVQNSNYGLTGYQNKNRIIDIL